MKTLAYSSKKNTFVGATFSFNNRLRRLLWKFIWFIFARWTPPNFNILRILILKIFGAKVNWNSIIYSSVKIWAPWNLDMSSYSTLGPNVNCYNIALIKIGKCAIVSQDVNLCTGTHDYNNPSFPLISFPIEIGEYAWIGAAAFVCPGISIPAGTIIGAASVLRVSPESWSIYIGNPAVKVKSRAVLTYVF